MQKVVIRNAIANDLPGIEKLEQQLFSDPWSADILCHDLLKGPGYYLVASCQDEVVGFICLWFVADEVQVVRIATAKQMQRQGIAEELLRRGIAEARDRKAVYLHLEVRKSNVPAIALYKKMGLTVRGNRKAVYEKPIEDGYIMALDLPMEAKR